VWRLRIPWTLTRHSANGHCSFDAYRAGYDPDTADVLFPLTPALSLGEREPRSLALETSKRLKFANQQAGVLPLPKGEGRGEGGRAWRIQPAPRKHGDVRREQIGHGHSRRSQRAYFLIETLVYIAVLLALLGAGYSAMYRCLDSSIALRRNADDIANALHAGERWRADLRAATSQPRLESTDAGQLLHFDSARGAVAYRFATNAVFRQLGGGAWVRLLPNVKSSTITADPREHVTAWCWELELQPRRSGSVNPSRVRPLFTFLAVPQQASTK